MTWATRLSAMPAKKRWMRSPKTLAASTTMPMRCRLVTKLEHRYADFDGLNLTWETLEGLVKHNGPLQPPLPGPDCQF